MVRRATRHGRSDREFVPLAGPLDEFHQYATGRAGVQECYTGPVGAFADQRFENDHSGSLCVRHGRFQVGRGETDVMDALAVLVEKASHG